MSLSEAIVFYKVYVLCKEFILEHLFGVNAFFAEFLEFFDNARTVFGIGYAEPLRGGVEYFAGSGSVVDEFVDHQGDEEFALEVLHVLGVREEGLEIFFAVCEVVGGEAPEVH